jgi:hypothetical protein
MSTSADADDEALLSKIQLLMDTTHHDEFLLIVLVLLTRVADDAKLEKIWFDNRDVLVPYCCRLEKYEYLHIVARLVSRLSRDTVSPQVFQVLFRALAKREETRAPLSAFDTDLCLALCIMPQDEISIVLDTAWDRFHQVCAENIVTQKDADDSVAPASQDSSGEWTVVNETLEALLIADEQDLETSFQQAILLLFMANGPYLCMSRVPLWYKPMMSLATNDDGPPSSLRPQWHSVLLQCTLQMAIHVPQQFSPILVNSKSTSSRLIKILFAYITSSSPQINSDLVSLAWTTLASMVQAFGFGWAMMSGSGSLGNATLLCTILRMATGEWRIQLGRLVVDGTAADDTIEPCGRVIVAVLFHVMHLADNKREKFQINGSALLHLRNSLQDALHSTVQFLCQPITQPTDSSKSSQAMAGRVLGGLLTEFDVWDGLPNGVSTDETLKALSSALQYTDKNQGALLQSLVMVLASVEDKDYCVKYLDKYYLLGKTLIQFLIRFWKDGATKDTAEYTAACQIAELWFSLTSPPPSVTAPLRKAIFQWIRKEVASNSPKNALALAPAVDCLLMLFGQDVIPSQREAQVMQRALDLCDD